MIILASPLLLNKLKIPHIIGMIAAGVVIGPYGFNVLDNDSSFAVFGQVGLLYLMFLAGLEIDMYHLRMNLRRGLLFGVLTLFIPLVLGVLTSVYVLGTNWVTALLLGSMYASHTLISYPVAARYGITTAPAVLIAIVGTIIAVTGALLVLAGAVNIHREGYFNPGEILWLTAKMALWGVGLVVLYPIVTRRFFISFSDRVTQYVFVLALVFLAAWTATLIGLEAVLGAFFAGLILNRFVPPTSPLMSSIEFVGNALFIPYFLISVGMMINIRVVANTSTLTVSAIMLAVALASKWLPAFITQKANRLDSHSREVIFGLTAAHTAVALAVVTLGFRMGMFDETILNSTILVILAILIVILIHVGKSGLGVILIILAAIQQGLGQVSQVVVQGFHVLVQLCVGVLHLLHLLGHFAHQPQHLQHQAAGVLVQVQFHCAHHALEAVDAVHQVAHIESLPFFLFRSSVFHADRICPAMRVSSAGQESFVFGYPPGAA